MADMRDRPGQRLLLGILFSIVVRPLGCEETRTREVTLDIPRAGGVCQGASLVLPEFRKKIGQRVYVENGTRCEITDIASVDKGPQITEENGVSQCSYAGTAILDNCEEQGGCLGGGGRPLRVRGQGRAAERARRADWG